MERNMPFDPKSSAFNFGNEFSDARLFGLIPLTQGLCGGMTYASLDYHHAGCQAPSVAFAPPANSSVLGRYIFLRHLQSLTNISIDPDSFSAMLLRLLLPGGLFELLGSLLPNDNGKRHIAALITPDDALRRNSLEGEWSRLWEELHAQRPAPVGLFGRDSAISGHQIVALSCREERSRRLVQAYDPNFPKELVELELFEDRDLELRRPNTGASYAYRGFFVEEYRPSIPPRMGPFAADVIGVQGMNRHSAFFLQSSGSLWRLDTTQDQPAGTTAADANVASFQALDSETVFVLGTDGNLWREPVTGTVPPPHTAVDADVLSFQALDADTVFVLGTDGNLWREVVTGTVPPPRSPVDSSVSTFQALDRSTVFVLGTDGNLWRETVTGSVPPPRQQVDANVGAFHAIGGNEVFILGTDGNLWRAPVVGSAPPPRIAVDADVRAFQAIDRNTVFVLGNDGNLWRESVTGAVPPPRVAVDADVRSFHAVDSETMFVVRTDGSLWRPW